ncbi:MAG: FtsQ-type POTRA domain-containing protein [Coriobacteriia bacterium]|nr:FtsQ-type POTRA domain-containing protein [Coriobacteriia bacterium]
MLLVVVAVVLVIAVGSIALYRSSIFLITKVEVMGNTQLSANEVRTLAAASPKATLLRFPAKEVSQRVSDSPWVRSVSVTRDFPDTMRIRVTEFVPSALVDGGGDIFWLVDSSGWVIAQQPQETTSTLITIRDLESFEASAGERSTSEALRNALRVWRALSSELRARTRTISAPSVDKTALMTTDDITIFVGSSADIERKDFVARRILEEQAGKVVSINVRTVDRPTWRGVDTK